MTDFEEKTYYRDDYLPFPKSSFYGKQWSAWPEYKDDAQQELKCYKIELRTVARGDRPYLSLRQAFTLDEIAEPHGCAILKVCLRVMEQRFDAAVEKYSANL